MSDSLEKARAWLAKHGLAFREETEGGELVHLDEELKGVLDQVRAEAREEAFKEAIAATNERIKHSGSLEVLRSVLETKRAIGSGAPSDATEETTP